MESRSPPRTRLLTLAAFALAGAIAGYVLHRVVGCPGGGCLITGSAPISTIYGLVVGLVLGRGVVS